MKLQTGMLALAVCLGGGAAHAENVTLDFASPESWLNDDPRFAVSTTNLHWWGAGYATEGVLFAWDHDGENTGPAVGRLGIDAAEGFVIEGVSFDLSGYRSIAASARFEILVDGELVQTGDYDFEGDTSHFTIALEPVSGTSFEIVFDNYFRSSYVGLDNVSFNVFNAAPAPGAMALLSLAGVVGNRRRRG
jgi:hypothetical protein